MSIDKKILLTGNITQEAGAAASELIKPNSRTAETALLQEYQKKDALAYLEYLYDAAQRVIDESSPAKLANMQCVVTAKIHYGFPDFKGVVSPNFFVHQNDDYAVPLTNAQGFKDYHRLITGTQVAEPSENLKAVYANYARFLAYWISNIEGPIYDTTVRVQKTHFSIGRPPLLAHTIEGNA